MASFVDLTHHLSPEALARKINPLKDLTRIALQNPQLISLANGDPHYSLFPIRRVEYEVASVTDDNPVASWLTLGASAPTQVLSVGADDESARVLRASLQYAHGTGIADALAAVGAINKFYHSAPHHVPIMTLGNADAITKCFRLLGAPGDHFLADEFTFGPMPLAADAHGVKWVPVKLDSGGIVPEELEEVLEGWDHRRGRRPHVLYTTPCGQNPTGATLSLERRKQIYAIAQKYDIIIVEDDPYYFLQYNSPSSDKSSSAAKEPFPVSFLSLDVDGRVIRLDTFSKIIAPGMRLGWITSSPAIHQHLLKLIDLSTQCPAGFPQALVWQLLVAGGDTHGWQLAGFDRWVRGLGAAYQRRRDVFWSLFEREVARAGWASADVPTSGMFVWVRVHVERHPRFVPDVPDVRVVGRGSGSGRGERADERSGDEWVGVGSGARTNAKVLMRELFDRCLANGLLVCLASIFILPPNADYEEEGAVAIEDRSNFIRTTFAGSEETIHAGVPILGRVLREFFADGSITTAQAE